MSASTRLSTRICCPRTPSSYNAIRKILYWKNCLRCQQLLMYVLGVTLSYHWCNNIINCRFFNYNSVGRSIKYKPCTAIIHGFASSPPTGQAWEEMHFLCLVWEPMPEVDEQYIYIHTMDNYAEQNKTLYPLQIIFTMARMSIAWYEFYRLSSALGSPKHWNRVRTRS